VPIDRRSERSDEERVVPATVPIAKPPVPFVSSHSRCDDRS